MIHVVFSVLVLLKLARRPEIDVDQAIAGNYVVASGLSARVLQRSLRTSVLTMCALALLVAFALQL